MCFRAFLQDPDDNDIATVTATVTDGLVSLTPEEIDCSPSIEDGTLSPVYPYPMANRDNQIKNVEKCPDSLSDEVEASNDHISMEIAYNKMSNNRDEEFTNSDIRENGAPSTLTYAYTFSPSNTIATSGDKATDENTIPSRKEVEVETFHIYDGFNTNEKAADEINKVDSNEFPIDDELRTNNKAGTTTAKTNKNQIIATADNLHKKAVEDDQTDVDETSQNSSSFDQIGINIAKLIEARNNSRGNSPGEIIDETKETQKRPSSVLSIQRPDTENLAELKDDTALLQSFNDVANNETLPSDAALPSYHDGDHGDLISSLHQAHDNNNFSSIGNTTESPTPSEGELLATKDLSEKKNQSSLLQPLVAKENSVASLLTSEAPNKHCKGSFETIYISSSDGSTSSLVALTNHTTPTDVSLTTTRVTTTQLTNNLLNANRLSPNSKLFLESLYGESSPPQVSSLPSNSVYDRFRDWSNVDSNHVNQICAATIRGENLDYIDDIELSEVFSDSVGVVDISAANPNSSLNIGVVKSLMESLFEATEDVSTTPSMIFADDHDTFPSHHEYSKSQETTPISLDACNELTSDDVESRAQLTSAEKEHFTKLLGCTIEKEFQNLASRVNNTSCTGEHSTDQHRKMHADVSIASVDDDNNEEDQPSNAFPEGCDFTVTPTKENTTSLTITTATLKIIEELETPLNINEKWTTEYEQAKNLHSSSSSSSAACCKLDDPTQETRLDSRDLMAHDVDNRNILSAQSLNNHDDGLSQNTSTDLPYLDETRVVPNISCKDKEDSVQAYLKQCDNILNGYQSESSQFETDYDDDDSRRAHQESIPITFVNDSMVQKLHLEKRHSQWRKKCYSLRHDFNPVYEDISTDDELTKLKKDRDDRFAYNPVFEYVTMDESEETDDTKNVSIWKQRKPLQPFINESKEISPSGKLSREQSGEANLDSIKIQLHKVVRKQPKVRVKNPEDQTGKENPEDKMLTSPIKKSKSKKMNKNKRKRLKKKQDFDNRATSWSSVLKQPDKLFHEGGTATSRIPKIPKIMLTKEIPIIDGDDGAKLSVVSNNKKPSSTLKKVKKRSTAKTLESVKNTSSKVTYDDKSTAVESSSTLTKTPDTVNSSAMKKISSKAIDDHKSVASERSSISTKTVVNPTTLPLDNILGNMTHPKSTVTLSSPLVGAVSPASPVKSSESKNETTQPDEVASAPLCFPVPDSLLPSTSWMEMGSPKKKEVTFAAVGSSSPRVPNQTSNFVCKQNKIETSTSDVTSLSNDKVDINNNEVIAGQTHPVSLFDSERNPSQFIFRKDSQNNESIDKAPSTDFCPREMNSSPSSSVFPQVVTTKLKELPSSKQKVSFADFIAKKKNLSLKNNQTSESQPSAAVSKEKNQPIKKDLTLKTTKQLKKNDQSPKGSTTTNKDLSSQPIISTKTNPNKDRNVKEDEDLSEFIDEELERQIDEQFGNFKRSTADMFSPTKKFDMSPCKTSDQRKQVLSETILKLRRLRNQQTRQSTPLLQQQNYLDVSPVMEELDSSLSSGGNEKASDKSSPLYINTTPTIDLNSPTSSIATRPQSLDLLSPTSSVISSASNEIETCLIETKSGCTMTVKKSYLKYPHRHEDGTKCVTQCSRLPIPVAISDLPPNLQTSQDLNLDQKLKERDAPSKAYFKFPHRHSDGTYCETICSRVLAREKQRVIFNEHQAIFNEHPALLENVTKPHIPIPWKLISLTIPKKSDLADPRLLPRTDDGEISSTGDLNSGQSQLNSLDPRFLPKEKLNPRLLIRTDDVEVLFHNTDVSNDQTRLPSYQETPSDFNYQAQQNAMNPRIEKVTASIGEKSSDILDGDGENMVQPTISDPQSLSNSLDTFILQEKQITTNVHLSTFPDQREFNSPTTASHHHENEDSREQNMELCDSETETKLVDNGDEAVVKNISNKQGSVLYDSLDKRKKSPKKTRWDISAGCNEEQIEMLKLDQTKDIEHVRTPQHPSKNLMRRFECSQANPIVTDKDHRTNGTGTPGDRITENTEKFKQSHVENEKGMVVSEFPRTDGNDVTKKTPQVNPADQKSCEEVSEAHHTRAVSNQQSQSEVLSQECADTLYDSFESQPTSTFHVSQTTNPKKVGSTSESSDINNEDCPTLDIRPPEIDDSGKDDINTGKISNAGCCIELKKETSSHVEHHNMKLEEDSIVDKSSLVQESISNTSLSSSQSVSYSNSNPNYYTATTTTTTTTIDHTQEIIFPSSSQHLDPNSTTTVTTGNHCVEIPSPSTKPVKKKMKMPALPFVFDATDTEEERNNWARRNQITSDESKTVYPCNQQQYTDQVSLQDQSGFYHSENYSYQQQQQQINSYYTNNWFHNNYYAHGEYYSYPTYSLVSGPYSQSIQHQYSHTAEGSYTLPNKQQTTLSGPLDNQQEKDQSHNGEPSTDTISSKESADSQENGSPKEPPSHSSLGVSSSDKSPSLPTVSSRKSDLSEADIIAKQPISSKADIIAKQPISSKVDIIAKQPISSKEDTPARASPLQDLYSPTQPTSSNYNSTDNTLVPSPDDIKISIKTTTPQSKFPSTFNPLKILSSGGGDEQHSPTTPQTPTSTAFPSPNSTTGFPFPSPTTSSSFLNYHINNNTNTNDRWRHFKRQTSDPGAVPCPLEWPQQQGSVFSTSHNTTSINKEPSSPDETNTSMWTVFQRLFSPPHPSSSNKSVGGVGGSSPGDPASSNDSENKPFSPSSLTHEGHENSSSPLWPASSPTSLSSNPQIMNLLNHLILQSLDDVVHEYFDEWLNSQEKTYLLEFSRGFVLGLLDKRSVASESELLQIINTGIRDALSSVQKRKQATIQPSLSSSLLHGEASSHTRKTEDEPFVATRNDEMSPRWNGPSDLRPWTTDGPFTPRDNELSLWDRPSDPRKRRPTTLNVLVGDQRLKRRRLLVNSVEDAFSSQRDVSTHHHQQRHEEEETEQRRRRQSFIYDTKIQADPDMYRNHDDIEEGELQGDTDLEEEDQGYVPQQQRRIYSAKLPVQKRRKRSKKKKSRRSNPYLPLSPIRDHMQTIDIQVQVNNGRRHGSRDVVTRNVDIEKTLNTSNTSAVAATTNKVFPKDLTVAKLSLDDIAQLNRMNSQGGQQRQQKRAFVTSPRDKAENDVTGWKLRQIRDSIATSPPTTSFFKSRKMVVQQQNKKKKSNNCLLYTSPSPRDKRQSRMPSSA